MDRGYKAPMENWSVSCKHKAGVLGSAVATASQVTQLKPASYYLPTTYLALPTE